MNFTMKQLRYAVAAAQYGSVTGAARALRVSQPSISLAVAQIEREVGITLFIRQRGSGTTTTPAGQRFVARSRALLADFAELAAFEAPDGPVTGHLVLDCFEDLAPFCVPAIVVRARRLHPGIEIAVHEYDLETVGKRLKSGASDLAITYELGVPKGLVTETLHSVAPHALLAADDPLARRKRLDLRTLCKAPLVFTREFLSLQHFFELLRSHGATSIKTLEAGSFEMQRSMVANGLGRAIAYTQSCSDVTYDGKRVVRRALCEALAPHPILLAYAPALRGSRAVDAFAQEARSYFRELPCPFSRPPGRTAP